MTLSFERCGDNFHESALGRSSLTAPDASAIWNAAFVWVVFFFFFFLYKPSFPREEKKEF